MIRNTQRNSDVFLILLNSDRCADASGRQPSVATDLGLWFPEHQQICLLGSALLRRAVPGFGGQAVGFPNPRIARRGWAVALETGISWCLDGAVEHMMP